MSTHPTTRPAFILGMALMVLLLVPAWALVGVFDSPHDGGEDEGAGHGGMMMMMSGSITREFGQKVQAFMAANTREDGCVVPPANGAMAGMEEKKAGHQEMDMNAGMDEATAGHQESEMTAGMGMDAGNPPADHDGDETGLPVAYLQALRFGYLPAKLCLQSGKTYELKMMATDVIHGASLQLGPGSKMIRLPPGVPVTERITFTKPGEYLLYCSSYCGLGHQYMQARVVVEAS